MTTREFSDSFDTLLNSYASQAVFGEGASKQEVVLDEYEKSVLLTQAQDIIVKSYFEKHTNELGQGFDDSSRRQVDFSSLITVEELTCINSTQQVDWSDGNGFLGTLTITNKTSSNLNLVIKVNSNSQDDILATYDAESNSLSLDINWDSFAHARVAEGITNANMNTLISYMNLAEYEKDKKVNELVNISIADTTDEVVDEDDYTVVSTTLASSSTMTYDSRGVIFRLPFSEYEIDSKSVQVSKVLYILNEKIAVKDKTYIVVPITYREYDREMSKPYAQPFKKQAWRLFQNITTGFDIYSELIPVWNLDTKDLKYRLRYVKRPTPIVLTDLPNGLTIDGVDTVSECMLNPIVHMDILNKAIEIAISTRGRLAPSRGEQQ